MLDGNTAEVECLEFLYGLVRLLKPELVLETGTWHGGMAVAIASALRQNGLGRLITFEIDQESCAIASRRLEAAGVKALAELRNESSLEAEVDGPIGLLILDSELSIRGEEFRRFRQSLKPGAIVVFHDTSTTHRVVREQIEALVAEGSLSAILIPSPRGLAVCQVKPA
jgi:predicted O-methyltransferase YrrM